MRTLAVTQNITVDGIIEMRGDWFDPQAQDDELLAEVRRQDESTDALLLGRQTFEDFRSYWPHATDDRTGIAAQLDTVQKHVVSSTLTEAGWQNTTILSGDGADLARELKETPGGDIVVTGSITLTHALVAAGLVDEYRLFVYPVVQGAGRPLFPESTPTTRLELRDLRRFRSGVALAVYAPAA
ncbi:dihydrofolate reductase family protein [Cellulomonas sp. DKR-3]|uniref:Dihydrofolate reductase family protein n=1 Tax=Cellulomonas fulva TaxID=2835530 RepID=A0ABS5TX20_9CELL|nr:dihydrofolate reductase family protein [Cellulomonas fulva]MBT0993698.1 dihydrofolate reductase family protein [Cellulomonas fulva]